MPLDLVTVIAIALLVYAVTNFLHEGIGHGGACLAFGGTPIALSSIHFECDLEDSEALSSRAVTASGTVVDFIAGIFAFTMLRSISASHKPHLYYATWLFSTLNLLMGAGYFVFSGVGNIGDWAAVVDGLLPPVIWRPIMAIFGFVLYFLLARGSARALRPLVGNNEHSLRRGRQFTIPAYLAGGLLYCVSGLFNPLGPVLIAISAAAASFGGASGLLWLTALLRHFKGPDTVPAFDRRRGWIGAGFVASVIFIALLGPTIYF